MSMEDIAQEQELKQWEFNNRPRPEPKRFVPGDAGYGPAECECGEPLPSARREWGFRLCIECQTFAEKVTRRR